MARDGKNFHKVDLGRHADRFDFDIKYPGKADDLIRKEVVLKLNIATTPGRADFASLEKAAQAAASQAMSRLGAFVTNPPAAPDGQRSSS